MYRLPFWMTSFTFSDIEKSQIQAGEQMPIGRKDHLFDQLLVSARRKRRCMGLIGKRLAQKGHGPVKVVQFQFIDTVNYIIPAPVLSIICINPWRPPWKSPCG